MARFQFRLQAVLRVRLSEREQRRVELAQAFEADRLLRGQIEETTAELAGVRLNAREAASPGAVDVDRLLALQRYAWRLQAQARGLEQQHSQVEQEIERRRQALVEADRQVRMLEKLLANQELLHRAAAQQAEQKVLDEVGARAADAPLRRNR